MTKHGSKLAYSQLAQLNRVSRQGQIQLKEEMLQKINQARQATFQVRRWWLPSAIRKCINSKFWAELSTIQGNSLKICTDQAIMQIITPIIELWSLLTAQRVQIRHISWITRQDLDRWDRLETTFHRPLSLNSNKNNSKIVVETPQQEA